MEFPVFVPFESSHDTLMEDLFGQIKEWIHLESDERFSQEELETTSSSTSDEMFSDESEYEAEPINSTKQSCPICHILILCSNLNRHIKMVHIKEKTHKCRHCSKAFSYAYELKVHLKVHSKIDLRHKPYVCNECNATYISKDSLNKHVYIKHRQQLKEGYPCHWCSKICFQKSILETHERTHTGHKPFECKCCGESFTQNGNLKRHLLKQHSDSEVVDV